MNSISYQVLKKWILKRVEDYIIDDHYSALLPHQAAFGSKEWKSPFSEIAFIKFLKMIQNRDSILLSTGFKLCE